MQREPLATRRGQGLQGTRGSASSPDGAPPRRAVPDPRGAPRVGVALFLRHDPLHVLLTAASRFGEVVSLGCCSRPLSLMNHPTLIEHLLEQPAHDTQHPSVTRITPLFGTGLTTSDRALWQPAAQRGQPLDLTAAMEDVTWRCGSPSRALDGKLLQEGHAFYPGR
jgi:hypothetical protein